MTTTGDPWKAGTTFDSIVNQGTNSITESAIDALKGTEFEFMGEKFPLPSGVGN
jgi:hypothetical protein